MKYNDEFVIPPVSSIEMSISLNFQWNESPTDSTVDFCTLIVLFIVHTMCDYLNTYVGIYLVKLFLSNEINVN